MSEQPAAADPADLGDYRFDCHFYSKADETSHGLYSQGGSRRAVVHHLLDALAIALPAHGAVGRDLHAATDTVMRALAKHAWPEDPAPMEDEAYSNGVAAGDAAVAALARVEALRAGYVRMYGADDIVAGHIRTAIDGTGDGGDDA